MQHRIMMITMHLITSQPSLQMKTPPHRLSSSRCSSLTCMTLYSFGTRKGDLQTRRRSSMLQWGGIRCAHMPTSRSTHERTSDALQDAGQLNAGNGDMQRKCRALTLTCMHKPEYQQAEIAALEKSLTTVCHIDVPRCGVSLDTHESERFKSSRKLDLLLAHLSSLLFHCASKYT